MSDSSDHTNFMRIAVACSGLGHVTRGNEAWAEDLAHALARRGEIVTLYKGAGKEKSDYERVVPCLRRMTTTTSQLDRWLPKQGRWRLGLGSEYEIEQTTFAISLIGRLRRHQAEIVHVPDPRVALILQRAGNLGWIRARTILAHETEESLETLEGLDHLNVITPQDYERISSAGAWKPSWALIPNFINTRTFHPGRDESLRAELGIPLDASVVLTAAAIKRDHKRIDYLLHEFDRFSKKYPDQAIWLVVAGGRDQDTDELMRIGRDLIGERVRFLPNFPRERMARLYKIADLFVLCSLKEMFGIVLLEAMASGLPCLVNRDPVLKWVIGPGGESIDMSTGGILSAALDGLLSDPVRRRRLGDQARSYCVEHFSEDRVVGQFLDYYRSVLSNRLPVHASL